MLRKLLLPDAAGSVINGLPLEGAATASRPQTQVAIRQQPWYQFSVTEEDVIRLQARQVEEEKIRQARAMSFREKFLAGAELFEEGCVWTLAGIRHQHPGISEKEALNLLKSRLKPAAVPQ